MVKRSVSQMHIRYIFYYVNTEQINCCGSAGTLLGVSLVCLSRPKVHFCSTQYFEALRT